MWFWSGGDRLKSSTAKTLPYPAPSRGNVPPFWSVFQEADATGTGFIGNIFSRVSWLYISRSISVVCRVKYFSNTVDPILIICFSSSTLHSLWMWSKTTCCWVPEPFVMNCLISFPLECKIIKWSILTVSSMTPRHQITKRKVPIYSSSFLENQIVW